MESTRRTFIANAVEQGLEACLPERIDRIYLQAPFTVHKQPSNDQWYLRGSVLVNGRPTFVSIDLGKAGPDNSDILYARTLIGRQIYALAAGAAA